MIIGCNIDAIDKLPYHRMVAFDVLNTLNEMGNEIVFISKCKHVLRSYVTNWISLYCYFSYRVVFCESDEEKRRICEGMFVKVMIDVDIMSFKGMSNGVLKIWLNGDKNHIFSVIKGHADVYNGVLTASTWMQVLQLLQQRI